MRHASVALIAAAAGVRGVGAQTPRALCVRQESSGSPPTRVAQAVRRRTRRSAPVLEIHRLLTTSTTI